MKLTRYIVVILCVMLSLTSQIAMASTKKSKVATPAQLSKVIRIKMNVYMSSTGLKPFSYLYTNESVGGDGASIPLKIDKVDYYNSNSVTSSESSTRVVLQIDGNLLPEILVDKRGNNTISVSGYGYIICVADDLYRTSKNFKVAASLKPGETKTIVADCTSSAGDNNSMKITLGATIDNGLVKLPAKKASVPKHKASVKK